jgi:hypothetical protein
MSKRNCLKGINRRCQKAGLPLAQAAFTAGDAALLDVYGQLRQDIRSTISDLRKVPSLVPFYRVESLRERLLAVQLIMGALKA